MGLYKYVVLCAYKKCCLKWVFICRGDEMIVKNKRLDLMYKPTRFRFYNECN